MTERTEVALLRARERTSRYSLLFGVVGDEDPFDDVLALRVTETSLLSSHICIPNDDTQQ